MDFIRSSKRFFVMVLFGMGVDMLGGLLGVAPRGGGAPAGPGALSPAFNAHSPEGQPAAPGDVLKFAEVIFNEGSLYDPSTGRFKADRPGLFYFTTSVLLSPGSAYRGQFDIRVRDAEGEMAELVCAAWGRSDRTIEVQTGCGGFAILSAGDDVTVEAYPGPRRERFPDNTLDTRAMFMTRFSGSLIQEYGEGLLAGLGEE